MDELEALLAEAPGDSGDSGDFGEVEATATNADVGVERKRATKPEVSDNPYVNVDDRIKQLMTATAAYVAAKKAAEAAEASRSSDEWTWTWTWWMILLVIAFLGVGAWFVYSWASRAGREVREARDE